MFEEAVWVGRGSGVGGSEALRLCIRYFLPACFNCLKLNVVYPLFYACMHWQCIRLCLRRVFSFETLRQARV